METEQIINKIPRGRPISVDVKNNKQYFKDYYHPTNKEVLCECGQHVKSKTMYKHKMSSKHEYIMKNTKLVELLKSHKIENI